METDDRKTVEPRKRSPLEICVWAVMIGLAGFGAYYGIQQEKSKKIRGMPGVESLLDGSANADCYLSRL